MLTRIGLSYRLWLAHIGNVVQRRYLHDKQSETESERVPLIEILELKRQHLTILQDKRDAEVI